MSKLRKMGSLAKSRWRHASCALLLSLALVLALSTLLLWSSDAPALTLPEPDTQLQPTLAAGGGHSLAVKSDGSLWTWGRNDHGQLGTNSLINRHEPTRVGSNIDWVAVAAGYRHSLAIREDGSLWAWGLNNLHQLGVLPSTNRSVPTQVGTDKDWLKVAGGGYHSLALKADGSLWSWGSNVYGQLYGQLGQGEGVPSPCSTPTRVGTDTDWVTISAGRNLSSRVRQSGLDN